MAISYSAGTGTTINSFLVGQAIPSQVGAAANQIYISAPGGSTLPSTATGYGGNVGTGASGLGDTYVGRIIVIRKGTGTEEIRIVTAVTYTTNIQTITVSENWSSQPVSTDRFDCCYEPGDIEDGGAGGGINLNTKSGLYELSNVLDILSGGGLQVANGKALEADDRGATIAFYIRSGGWFFAGLRSAGADISGAILPSYNNATGEPNIQIASGGNVRVYDTLIWAQLVPQHFENVSGSISKYYRTKWLNNTQELHLYSSSIDNCSVGGKGTATEIVRVNSGTVCNGLVLSNIQYIDTTATTTVETINLEGVLFASVPGYVNIRQNKIWNLIDPIWTVTTYTQLTWTGTATGNELNDKRSIKATITKADGTLLQNAVVNIYEHTQTLNLVLKLVSDINGYVSSSFVYKKHATNSLTTTYGGHALQVGKWLYKPYVATQLSTDNFSGSIVLTLDNNIIQTIQSTAITAGSGITWNNNTNPSELFDFTAGSGTLAVGMILTFTGGAVGTITQSLTGDSTAGTLHLETRNATAITNGDTFARTGGTAGTFSGTYTNNTTQKFSIHIKCNSLSLQTVYDYYAAITTETTLSAAGEIVWEWCRDSQSQAVFATGTSFYTEMSYNKGIILLTYGSGTIDYFTDNSGVTWTPPASVTLTFEGLKIGTEVRIYKTSDNTELYGIESTAGTTAAYTYDVSIAGTNYYAVIFHVDYKDIRLTNQTLPSSSSSIPIQQQTDRNYSNP